MTAKVNPFFSLNETDAVALTYPNQWCNTLKVPYNKFAYTCIIICEQQQYSVTALSIHLPLHPTFLAPLVLSGPSSRSGL